MNEESSGLLLSEEDQPERRAQYPVEDCDAQPEGTSFKAIEDEPNAGRTSSPFESKSISDSCSMLKNGSSSTVTTAVYEAGGETTIVDGHTGTATVVEGAEVVRSAAISYATPILHHVLLQGSPLIYSTVSSSSFGSSSSSSSTESPEAHQGSADHVSTPLFIKSSEGGGGGAPTRKNPKNVPLSSPPSSPPCKKTSIPILVITSQIPSSFSSSTSYVLSSPIHSGGSTPSSLVVATPDARALTSDCKSSPAAGAATCYIATAAALQSNQRVSPSTSHGSSRAKNDDELTSLSWLQDSSFILGTALSPIKTVSLTDEKRPALPQASPSKVEPAAILKREETTDKTIASSKSNTPSIETPKLPSTPNDSGEDPLDCDEPELVINDEISPSSTPKPQQSVPYDPLLHIKTKPPYSFSCLIFMAIENSQTKAIPVKDIYMWILSHFPYYRNAPTGWKNSVRHNLSLNKCFRKVEKAPNLGKGSLWMVDPTYRPNLLQALSKIPLHPYSNVDKVYMMPNRTVGSSPKAASSKRSENSHSPTDAPKQREVPLPSSSSSDSYQSDSTEESTLARTEESLSIKAVPGLPFKLSNTDSPNFVGNPELFPLLAKRLEANLSGNPKLPLAANILSRDGNSVLQRHANLSPSNNGNKEANNNTVSYIRLNGTHEHLLKKEPNEPLPDKIPSKNTNTPNGTKYSLPKDPSCKFIKREATESLPLENVPLKVESEDVDAAAAMLILKHGPNVISWDKGIKRENSIISSHYSNKRKQKHQELVDPDMMLISSCASLDHEYSTPGSRQHKLNGENGNINSSSVNGFHNSAHHNEEEEEEDWNRPSCLSNAFGGKNSLEKADALLNLASIATSLALNQNDTLSSSHDKPITSIRKSINWRPENFFSGQIPPKRTNKRKAFQPKKAQKRVKKGTESSKPNSSNNPLYEKDTISHLRKRTLNNNNYEHYLTKTLPRRKEPTLKTVQGQS